MALFIACMIPTAGRSQPRGPGAPGDSLGRPVFGFLRPTYDTNYSIQRQQTSWTQNFKFANQFGRLSMDNSTEFRVKTDPSRPDSRAQDGRTQSQFAYSLFDLIPLKSRVQFDRSSSNNLNAKDLREHLNTAFDGSYVLKLIPGARTTLTAGLGAQRSRTSILSSGIETGVKETALSRMGSVGTIYNAPATGMVLKLDSSFNGGSSKPKRLNEASLGDDDPRSNSSNDHNFTWTYAPIDGLDARLNYRKATGNDNYIVSSRDTTEDGRDEVRKNSNRTVGAGFRFSPKGRPGTEFTADYSNSDNQDRRVVQLKLASDRSASRVDLKARHKVMGASTFLHYENGNEDDRPATRASSNTLTRVLDGFVERPWGSRFTTRFSGEIRLRSRKFSNGLRDDDQLRNRVEGIFTYKPWPKLSMGLSGRRNLEDVNSIHPGQSVNTRREESYGLGADVKYNLTAKTRIGQTYNFNELFTSLRFNPRSDNIQRNREVNTTLSTSVTPKVKLELRHQYKFRETGGYRRAQGIRYFSRGDLRYEQDLKASVSYVLKTWLTFRTEERFFRIDDVSLAADTRRTTSRAEFSQNLTFNRPIPGGGTISATLDVWIQKQLQPVRIDPNGFVSTNISLSKPF